MLLATQVIIIILAIIATDRLFIMRKEGKEISSLRRIVSLIMMGAGLIVSLGLLLEMFT